MKHALLARVEHMFLLLKMAGSALRKGLSRPDKHPVQNESGAAAKKKSARVGIITALSIVCIALAGAVALLISGVQEELPVIGGLDYRVIQVGLVVLVVLFSGYTYERERHNRKLHAELMTEKVEAARMSAELQLLKQVQTERDTVATILLAAADGVMVVDRDRRVERINPALQEMTNWTEYRAKGRYCEDVFGCRIDGRLACGTRCPFSQVFEEAEPIKDHSFQYGAFSENPRWLSGAYGPVRDDKGDIVLAVGAFRDVTKTKEIEQLQHDFVSIVSHELRGPLTAIKGFIKTLLKKEERLPPETRQDFLETINQQADRLNQLVEDLLNVSRIESRRLKMTLSEVDLEALTKKLVSEFQTKWSERDISIEPAPGMPLVRADEKKLEEIFINLIDNAIKYSPAGGPIKVMMWPTSDAVEVAVEDSGIGMAPEDTMKLFQRFHRIATVETRDIGGTGLGLYIVKNLVEAHGGTIVVSSAPGVGTTFTFSLPVRGPAETVS